MFWGCFTSQIVSGDFWHFVALLKREVSSDNVAIAHLPGRREAISKVSMLAYDDSIHVEALKAMGFALGE